MKIINFNDLDISDTPHKVDVRKLHAFEHAAFVIITLQPGESLKMHITPVDVSFFILEGKGAVHIGDEVEQVHKGDYIFSPAKIRHKLSNNGTELFRFLVIKTPNPTNRTQIL